MSATTSLINTGDVKRVLQEIVAEYPDRRNPILPESLTCAYTDDNDPNWHCLGGELLLRFGARLPKEGHPLTATLDYGMFTNNALGLLSSIQSQADRRDDNDQPRKWSDVLAELYPFG